MNNSQSLLISIIVPAYNVQPYIERTVRSLFAQTYSSLEIIVVDDGSTDETIDVLNALQKEDSRLKIIQQENSGVTKARFAGIKQAHGNYIGFIDGDDYAEPEMFEILLKNAIQYQADISHCGYRMIVGNRTDYYYNTGKIIQQDHQKGLHDLLSGDFVEPGLVNKLYKSNLLQRFLACDEMDLTIKNNEDLLMNCYLFNKAQKSIYQDICPYHYIVRQNSATSGIFNEHQLKDPLKVLNNIRETFKGNEELTGIIDRRILARYITVATMQFSGNPKFKEYQSTIKKSMRPIFWKVLFGQYSLKQKIQYLTATFIPKFYRTVYKKYALLRKYDIKYKPEGNLQYKN